MLAALLLLALPVRADRGVPLSNSTHALLPNGLILEVKDGGLFIERAGARAPAPLPEERLGYRAPVKSLASISATDNKSWVTVKFNDACDNQDELTFNLNALWARTENGLGLAAYGRKEYPAAISLFARALQMDPGFDAAAANEAAALALSGKTDEALEALAMLIAKEPARAYLECLTNGDLGSLLKEPRLANLKPAQAGSAQLGLETVMAGGVEFAQGKTVAYEHARALVAAVQHKIVSTADGEEDPVYHWKSALIILDGKSGKTLTRLPLVELEDTPARGVYGKPAPVPKAKTSVVAKRLELANRALADLGLDPAESRKAVLTPPTKETPSGFSQFTFPGSALRLTTSSGGQAELIDVERVAASFPNADYAEWAAFLPFANLVVFQWGQFPSEGCPRTRYEGVAVLRP